VARKPGSWVEDTGSHKLLASQRDCKPFASRSEMLEQKLKELCIENR
jgi:hypothetical protein